MMNKSKLKTFAIAARIDVLGRVSDRAAFYGLTKTSWEKRTYAASDIYQKPDGSLLTRAEIAQRERLIQRLSERGFDYVIEEAAYTWFNRLIAIRYMQQHMLLPLAMRVLPQAPGQLPQIIEEAHLVELPGLDVGRVLSLIEASRTEALYKYLIITLCNALNASLPQMFETISDYTELLFPDNLLRAESALGLLAELEDDNWQEIQVIGWLYQYYNTELKDETFDLLKKNVKITKDRIGAATQLFTPEWIVRYMVENSLGRLWLEGHPSPSLRARWRYYLDEAAQEPEVEAQLQVLRAQRSALRPEDIRLIDPCMGSGHILVYAFDLLMDIYRSVGYTDRDAVESILTHNLYGLDIDDRASQLAYFALMMKACEYDKRFLKRGIQPRVCAIQESNSLAAFEGLRGQLRLDTHCLRTANELIATFKDAKIYGSLIPVTIEKLGHVDSLITQLEDATTKSLEVNSWLEKAKKRLRQLAEQATILQAKYDVVVTNPPYASASGLNNNLVDFLKTNYPDSKSDLFSSFIERCKELTKDNSFLAMITQQAWMFLSSYEKLRYKLMSDSICMNMVHLGNGSFGFADFGLTSFVYCHQYLSGYIGTYFRLLDNNDPEWKEKAFLNYEHMYIALQDNFSKIPSAPVAYWSGERVYQIFQNNTVRDYTFVGIGMRTGDNDRFLRSWYEVSILKAFFSATDKCSAIKSKCKWFPYNKGGEKRRWYGNDEFIVNWENDGAEIKENTRLHYPQLGDNLGWKISNEKEYYKPLLTWTFISSAGFGGIRFKPYGFICDVQGSMITGDIDTLSYIGGFLCSKVSAYLLDIVNPTVSIQVKDIATLPVILDNTERITKLVQSCVDLAHNDWDNYEYSWNFLQHSLI